MGHQMKRIIVLIIGLFVISQQHHVLAQEVEKGAIPENQLATSYKTLDWGVAIWDVDEAVSQLKSKEPTLWVDTRPESFFNKGTVRDAVLLSYDKKGNEDNGMTSDTLDKALKDAGLSKDNAKIVMFCQGPKCHRSYNATFVAVTEWGYQPENVVWFRAGYPLLLKAVQANQKLARKAKRYLSDAGMKNL